MLQLVYVRTPRPGLPVLEPLAILEASRRNNARDAITGLLYSDSERFLQALEGPADRVQATYARIQADPRHSGITLLSRRPIIERAFGGWAMAHHMAGMDADAFVTRVGELVAEAPNAVRAILEDFTRIRHAA